MLARRLTRIVCRWIARGRSDCWPSGSRRSESEGSDTDGDGAKCGQERSGAALGSELNGDGLLNSGAVLGASVGVVVHTLGVSLRGSLYFASGLGIDVLGAASVALLVGGELGLGDVKAHSRGERA